MSLSDLVTLLLLEVLDYVSSNTLRGPLKLESAYLACELECGWQAHTRFVPKNCPGLADAGISCLRCIQNHASAKCPFRSNRPTQPFRP